MPPSQIQTPPPGPPVERRAGTRSGAAPRQPRHHSPGSRASGVPARRLLVLLVAVLAQGPVARWTPELAFAVKRVGSVAISPDGRWAAVEVAEARMEAEPSEWRTSVYLYAVGGAGQQAARRVETPASAPAWSPAGRWLAFASSRSGKRDVWRVALDGSGGAERLTDVTGEGELGEFRWSPDGRRIAFVLTDPPVSVRDARVVGEAQRFARLYLVDVTGDAAGRGRVARLLTPQDVQVGGHVGAGMSGPAFDWSPDGAAPQRAPRGRRRRRGPFTRYAHGVRAGPERHGDARRVRFRVAGPRAGAVRQPAHAVRGDAGRRAAITSRHPVRQDGADSV